MNNFHYALTLTNTLYGISIQDEEWEEIAIIAWNQIGNKRCKLYRYTTCLSCDNTVELPCNCDSIEAITVDFEDFQHVSNTHSRALPGSFSTEQWIESEKTFTHPLYISGKYAQFERVGDTIYFPVHYPKVNILYKGIVADEDGLPEITDKEAIAIAAYCAYVVKFKEGLLTNNKNTVQMAEMLRQQWLIKCDAARVPESITQNEMDEVLDVRQSFDRKSWNKSYKPVR